MTRRRTLLTALTVGTVGTAGCLGILGGGEESAGEQEAIAADTTAAPTTAVSTQQTVEQSGDGSATAGVGVDLTVRVDDLTECGWRCRTLSYTVQNTGDASAEGVGASLTVHSPDLGGETVYEADQSLDRIDPQRQRGATAAVELDEAAAETVRSNDGRVVLALTVSTSDDTSESVSVERTLDLAPAREAIDFDVVLNELTECGRTCRTADYTVQNRGEAGATGISSRVRVYTPDQGGDQVYDDTQDVGDLAAGTEKGVIKDVDTGAVDGRKIQNNDGEIVIRLNLSSEEGATGEFTFDAVLDV